MGSCDLYGLRVLVHPLTLMVPTLSFAALRLKAEKPDLRRLSVGRQGKRRHLQGVKVQRHCEKLQPHREKLKLHGEKLKLHDEKLKLHSEKVGLQPF